MNILSYWPKLSNHVLWSRHGRMGFFFSIEISYFDPAAMHFVSQGVQNLRVNSIPFTTSYGRNFKNTNIWINVDLFALESCETTVYIGVFLYLFHRLKKIQIRALLYARQDVQYWVPVGIVDSYFIVDVYYLFKI